jgi:hypothetical protein
VLQKGQLVGGLPNNTSAPLTMRDLKLAVKTASVPLMISQQDLLGMRRYSHNCVIIIIIIIIPRDAK